MATLTATLTMASTDVTSDPLSFTISKALTTKAPALGISRAVAPITTPTSLVPADAGTKYCYVKHMAKKSDGSTTSTNTVTIATQGDGAAVREVTTVTFSADLVTSNSVTITVDGTALSPVVFATSHDATMAAIATAIQATAGVLTATASGRVITVTGANAGDPFTLTSSAVTGGASQATVAVAEATSASGAAYAVLRPEEWLFLPVKAGEGLTAVASGTTAADGVLLEYAYFTKSTE